MTLGTLKYATPPGESFPEHYQHYMAHSESVHRFARSPVLQSYVAMWLFSKYRGYADRDSFQRTAEAVFRRGIQGATDRQLGESDTDRARHIGTAFDAGDKKINALDDENSKTGKKMKTHIADLKRRMARQMLESMTGHVFGAQNTFQRRQLQELLEEYFVDAVASTGGALKSLFDESMKLASRYAAIYRKLLSVIGNPTFLADPAKLEERISGLGAGDDAEALRKTANRAKELVTAEVAETPKPNDLGEDSDAGRAWRRHVRAHTMQCFASEVGEHAVDDYADRFDRAEERIETDVEMQRWFYRASRQVSRATGQVSERSAGAVLPPVAASRTEALSGSEVEAVSREIASNSPGTEQKFPVPEEIQGRIRNEEIATTLTGSIKADEKPIGSVTVTEDGTWVSIDNPDFDLVDPMNDVTLDTSVFDDIDIGTLDKAGDMRNWVGVVAQDSALPHDEVKARVSELTDFAEHCEHIRALYCGEGKEEMNGEAYADFCRAVRARLLGECFQSARDQESRLGMRDVSKTLQLMLLLVRHVGELDNSDLARARPDQDTTAALGPVQPGQGPPGRLNLSLIYPVSDEDGPDAIVEAMTYYDTMCESVESVREHLADLADLAAIADALPHDARLVVVNATASEYLDSVRDKKEWIFGTLHPCIALFGRGAGAGEPEGWKSLADTFWDEFESSDPRRDDKVQISCPTLIAHKPPDGSCIFPVVDLGAMSRLALRAVPVGTRVSSPVLEAPAKPRVDGSRLVLGVEGAYAAPSLVAAMAIAPLVGPGVLGKFPDGEIAKSVSKAVEDAAGVNSFHRDASGELLCEFLRRCWAHSSTNNALAAMVAARLATLALAARGSGVGSYERFYNRFLAEHEDGPHPALEGAEPVLGPQAERLRLFPGERPNELHKVPGAGLFSYDGNVRVEISKLGDDTEGKPTTAYLPGALRKGFSFTKV